MVLDDLEKEISAVNKFTFEALALKIFQYQSQNNEVYKTYLQLLKIDTTKIDKVFKIPFLPISFFKTFNIQSTSLPAEIVFESSSTTGVGISKHAVPFARLYENSCAESFSFFFGDYKKYCHLALLPSYLERTTSSLVYQVNHFIKSSQYPQSNFYLYNHHDLYNQLMENEAQKIPTVLWGVSFALLDFVEKYQMNLEYTHVVETGGMKGRRAELTRHELHQILQSRLGVSSIAGEYGMTELMSQFYAMSEGLYQSPPWCKVFAREINDPLGLPVFNRNGVLNVIDLYNLYSCSFIATSDLGKVNDNGSYEVLGRVDYSDTRGCNLLVL
jgi:phenylacetate-coenzyme A ligase PaaK-like adenylate-forming protein